MIIALAVAMLATIYASLSASYLIVRIIAALILVVVVINTLDNDITVSRVALIALHAISATVGFVLVKLMELF